MKNSIKIKLIIVILIKLALANDKSYYQREYDEVLELCKKDLNCKNQLNESNNIYELLEPYYVAYWKSISCQRENEPCGSDWGLCCNQLECQYISTNSVYDSILLENIGLCSFKNTTYIIPNH
jgi:hypothetical protein